MDVGEKHSRESTRRGGNDKCELDLSGGICCEHIFEKEGIGERDKDIQDIFG